MTIYNWLCLFGVPTIIGGAIAYARTQAKKNIEQINAVKRGVQALLRAQMISDYNKWMDKGYAPIYARQNFENCWQNYHDLGANGVMDDIHIRFLQLPTEPEDATETKGE